MLIAAMAFGSTLKADPRYFHTATLVSLERSKGEERYTIDGPWGIFRVRYKTAGRIPRLQKGEVRISVARDAKAGDVLRFLDWDGKEYKAVIVDVTSHPPPPAVF